MNKDITSLCSHCNSIVEVTLNKVPIEFSSQIHDEIKEYKRLRAFIINLAKEYTYSGCVRVCGEKIKNYDEEINLLKVMLAYTHYYDCPICDEPTFLKIK